MRANREIYVLLTGRISIADCSSRSVVVLISYDLGKLPDEGLYRVTAILNEKNRKKIIIELFFCLFYLSTHLICAMIHDFL
jgi:hypothetical protein